MDDLIVYLILIAVGFLAGWKGREFYAQVIVTNYLRQLEDGLPETSDVPNALNIEVEKHSDVFYVYNTENNAFITQVKTKEEMFEFFKNKYPNRTVMMKKEHFALFEAV